MGDRHEQARRSIDPMAAIELLDEMECWSEDAFCAGWHIGLATMVDVAIAGGYHVGDDWHQVRQQTLDTFKRTRAACGGTWIFDGDVTGWRRFVTDAEWDAMGCREPNDTYNHGRRHA